MSSSTTPPSFARMPLYPRDFRSSTLGWPLVARGAYYELLCAQWDCGGATVATLPGDDEALRNIAGATPAEWRIAWPYLKPKFPEVDGGRRNARLETHRRAAVDEFMRRRKGAQKTNAQRWGHGGNGTASNVGSDS